MLAIVIPYYKLTFFEATLNSLANQTDTRFKVYIGDDASPENPKYLLQKYQGQFDFVYYRFDTNLGSQSLTKQWERCIALIGNEDWIMVLGDDDFLDNTVVESWYDNYDLFHNKANIIRFASKTIIEETKAISNLYIHPDWELATDSFLRKYYHLTRSSLSEYVFSKVSYLKFGFYDYPLAWNSDDRAWLDFSNAKPIFTINESVVYIRFSSLNISGKEDNLASKNLSLMAFFKYIVTEKLQFYDKTQQVEFLRRYENAIKIVRPLKQSEWLFLFFFYINNFDFVATKKFLKRFLSTIFKRQVFIKLF